MALLGRKFLAIAALVASSSTLQAQAAAATCDVGQAAKGNAARAMLSVDLASKATSPAAAANNLRSAVKLLDHLEKGDDPVTNAYMLGTALSLWANQPGIGLNPKRGQLGFSTNMEATIDLPSTLDSLFRAVETVKPACTDNTAYYRAGQKFYLDVVNGAINALNSDKLDSAEYLAAAANKLYAPSPYGTMVLAGVAQTRNDLAKAKEYWSAAAAVAAKDSAYREVERQMLASLGAAYMDEANTATGAARTEAARKAAEAYATLIAIPGTRGSYLGGGRQQLQAAYMMAGDTAAAVKTWAPLVATPSAYEYIDLLNSAVNASRANRSADAAKLFEGALAGNAYSRDALFNLAVTYLTLEQNDKVTPLVTRLVAVDPGNPENYNLSARAYLALSKAARDAKKATVAAAYNDSTLTWYTKGLNLPVEVLFAEFSPTDKQVTMSGTILDRREKKDEANAPPPPKAVKGKPAPKAPPAKTYPPRAVTLNFVALDKDGKEVGSKSITTEPLTPGKSARFSVTIPAANAVAYRYTLQD